MRELTEADVLDLWESGRHANPVQRALLLARIALPQVDEQELRQWPLGRRDGALLLMRGVNFGEHVSCLVECPACGTTLELNRTLDAVRAGMPQCDPESVREVSIGALRCELRAPTSDMVERAWSAGDVEAAEQRLREDCVRVLSNPAAPAARELDADQWMQVEDDLQKMDPWADLSLEVACGECGREWRANFDIAHFFWEELAQRARRVLMQVHRIASAYGWSQHAILGMSALRRQSYIDCLARESMGRA